MLCRTAHQSKTRYVCCAVQCCAHVSACHAMPVFTAVAKIFCLEADCDKNTVILLLVSQVLF